MTEIQTAPQSNDHCVFCGHNSISERLLWLVPTTLILQTLLPPSVPLGSSGTAQIIAPIWESSFSAGPMHIHVSPWTPLDLASWSS